MKDKDLKGDGQGEGSEVLSDTLRYLNLTDLVTGLVSLCGPMNQCTCVREEGGDGQGAGSEALSDTLRYINLAGLVIGLVTLRGPMHLCACVSDDSGEFHFLSFFFSKRKK